VRQTRLDCGTSLTQCRHLLRCGKRFGDPFQSDPQAFGQAHQLSKDGAEVYAGPLFLKNDARITDTRGFEFARAAERREWTACGL
jgi:hypothetical protein